MKMYVEYQKDIPGQILVLQTVERELFDFNIPDGDYSKDMIEILIKAKIGYDVKVKNSKKI